MNKKEFLELQKLVSGIQGKHERKITVEYLKTLEHLNLKLSTIFQKHADDGMDWATWNKNGYTRKISKEITKSVNALVPIQNGAVKDYIEDVYEETYYQNAYSMEKEAGGLSKPIFALLGALAIKKVLFNPKDDKKWTDRSKKNNRVLSGQLKGIITNGIANGHGYDKVAKAITAQMGIGSRKAIMIAQTETGRVYAQAKQDSMEDAVAGGLQIKKRWLATLDSKTRDTHQQLDGVTIDVDDFFMSGGYTTKEPHGFGVMAEDINCRCDMITVFEGIDFEKRMSREIDRERGEVVEYKNYSDWKSNLK